LIILHSIGKRHST